MKDACRSEHSGTVVKKKSSSGCLIIKKKVADGVGGARGYSDSASRNLSNSSKEKKRARVVQSDSESSDESPETIRRKVDKFHNGSVVYKGVYMENREFETEKRVSNGLDVFEFDEYDGFDERTIRKDVNDGRYRLNLYRQSGDLMECGSGHRRVIVDKGRDSHCDDESIMFSTHGSRPTYGTTSQFEMEDDESDLPLSVLSERYRISSNVPIRLQGKNGVLKVMVNKNKQMGVSQRKYGHSQDEDQKEPKPRVLDKRKLNVSNKRNDGRESGNGQSSRSEDANKNKAVMKSSLHSNFKCPGKRDESKGKEKDELKFLKPMLAKGSKETNESDAPKQFKSYSRRDVVKNEGNDNTPTENIARVKGKEGKAKRGSGTEKQLLREKIKNMLLAAGWTIDYRPRRNRDYLDAVYISPAGTAYWSIIKAYEALQKEEEDNCKAGGNFTPLPDELLGKLTRQTRKKMEREMKKKRKSEGSSRNAKRARVKEVAEDEDSDQQEEKLNSYMKHSRRSKKSRLEEASQGSDDHSNDKSYKGIPKYDRAAKTTVGTNSHMVHGRKSRKIGRCTLLVRSSDKWLNSESDGFVPYSGKRTLLSWLIDSGTVHMSEHVQYMNRRKTRIMQKGWITNDGIHCGCCSKIVTVLKFELHAGSKLRQPFPNIFLQSGKSLMQCQIDAWNRQGESEQKGFYSVDVDGDDPNDDTCGLCGDGGDLICCDGCPSTFHQSCLDIQMLPQGDWHCPNCSCKYCEIAGGNCTEVGDKIETSLLMCCLCEKKYHDSCRPEMDVKPIDSNYSKLSFCGQNCQELYSRLQKLLGVKHELDSGFSWSLIHRSDLSSEASSAELSQRVECNSMLAVAMSVMDECFLPIADRRSGINLIRNVVFNCGSNLRRLNYNAFLTAILERGDEVLCAASIRIHGTQLAEMPFIGTRHIYRRQGMCRRLLSAIESALSSLQVEKLIIPAIAEHMHTWTDIFGFHPLDESHKQELRSMNMLVFPGTDMLQKPLVKQGNPSATPEGKNTIEVEDNNALPKKYELNSCDVKESSDKITTTEFGSQESIVPSDDGCSVDASKETLLINSLVKDEMPVPGKLVSNSSAGLDNNAGDDTSKQNGGPTNQTADADSVLTQVPDVASCDAVSSDVPCATEPQLSVSVDGQVDSNAEEFSVQEGNVGTTEVTALPSSNVVPSHMPCEPKLQLSGEESVSIDSHFNPSVEEIAVQDGNKNVNDPSHVTIPSDIPCKTQLQLSGKEPVSSVDILTEPVPEKVDLPNGGKTPNATTDVISVQAEAFNVPPNETVCLDTPCEHELQSSAIEPVSLDAHIMVRVDESFADVIPVILETGKLAVEDKSQVSSGNDGSCESEMKTQEKERIILGAVPECDITSHSEVGNEASELHSDLPGTDEKETRLHVASEVASNAEAEHIQNASTSRVL